MALQPGSHMSSEALNSSSKDRFMVYVHSLWGDVTLFARFWDRLAHRSRYDVKLIQSTL